MISEDVMVIVSICQDAVDYTMYDTMRCVTFPYTLVIIPKRTHLTFVKKV